MALKEITRLKQENYSLTNMVDNLKKEVRWQPTLMFRVGMNGEIQRLQQQWIGTHSGEIEWRSVPRVWVDSGEL